MDRSFTLKYNVCLVGNRQRELLDLRTNAITHLAVGMNIPRTLQTSRCPIILWKSHYVRIIIVYYMSKILFFAIPGFQRPANGPADA